MICITPSILMYLYVVKVKNNRGLELSLKVASTSILPQSSDICLQKDMLNKSTWGVKSVRSIISNMQAGRCDQKL